MSQHLIILGRVLRAHGVRGALLIQPLVEDTDLILSGRGLRLLPPDGGPPQVVELLRGRSAGPRLVVTIQGLDTRESAEKLKGWQVALPRTLMPSLEEGEFYWSDLTGLEVRTPAGEILGRLVNFLDAGAGILLAVADEARPERELLIPEAFLTEVDSSQGRLTVDPPPGLLELF